MKLENAHLLEESSGNKLYLKQTTKTATLVLTGEITVETTSSLFPTLLTIIVDDQCQQIRLIKEDLKGFDIRARIWLLKNFFSQIVILTSKLKDVTVLDHNSYEQSTNNSFCKLVISNFRFIKPDFKVIQSTYKK